MVQEILRRSRVKTATELSTSTIYALMQAGKFPKPIPIGTGRAVGWLSAEIEAWQQARIAMRDAKSASES